MFGPRFRVTAIAVAALFSVRGHAADTDPAAPAAVLPGAPTYTAPIHDQTTRSQGVGYLEDTLSDVKRRTVVVGSSNRKFQIPNRDCLQPSLRTDGFV